MSDNIVRDIAIPPEERIKNEVINRYNSIRDVCDGYLEGRQAPEETLNKIISVIYGI